MTSFFFFFREIHTFFSVLFTPCEPSLTLQIVEKKRTSGNRSFLQLGNDFKALFSQRISVLKILCGISDMSLMFLQRIYVGNQAENWPHQA